MAIFAGGVTDFIQASTSALLEFASKNRQPLLTLATLRIHASCSDRSQRLFLGDVMPESERRPPKK
jgi:hypothetical protein